MVISYLKCPFNPLAIQSLSVKTFLFQKISKYIKTSSQQKYIKAQLRASLLSPVFQMF